MTEKEMIGKLLDNLQKEMFCTKGCFGCCGDGKIDITCDTVISNFKNELLKHFQPKIPEGAVVLPREEYNAWVNYYNDVGQQIRKETAREILGKVDRESNGQTTQITNLLRKQYGLGVE